MQSVLFFLIAAKLEQFPKLAKTKAEKLIQSYVKIVGKGTHFPRNRKPFWRKITKSEWPDHDFFVKCGGGKKIFLTFAAVFENFIFTLTQTQSHETYY